MVMYRHHRIRGYGYAKRYRRYTLRLRYLIVPFTAENFSFFSFVCTGAVASSTATVSSTRRDDESTRVGCAPIRTLHARTAHENHLIGDDDFDVTGRIYCIYVVLIRVVSAVRKSYCQLTRLPLSLYVVYVPYTTYSWKVHRQLRCNEYESLENKVV